MPFTKGKSGNPAGRPKVGQGKSKSVLVREAWEKLVRAKPWLIKEALERGLTSGRPLGYLELGARVNKEIGQREDTPPSITIIVNSPLQSKALRPVDVVPLPRPESHLALPAPIRITETIEVSETRETNGIAEPTETVDLDLLESEK